MNRVYLDGGERASPLYCSNLSPTDMARRTPRQLRSDAVVNRARILDAARMAFSATDNVGAVTMQSVARAAGVGQGSLYRHFPTREALLLAVYEVDVERLVSAGAELLAIHPPCVALRRWLDQLASYGRVKRGLTQVVRAGNRDNISQRWRRPVLDALGELLGAAQVAEEVRPDIDAEGLWRLVAFLWSEQITDDWAERSTHLLDILFDGLQTQQHSSPPAPRSKTRSP